MLPVLSAKGTPGVGVIGAQAGATQQPEEGRGGEGGQQAAQGDTAIGAGVAGDRIIPEQVLHGMGVGGVPPTTVAESAAAQGSAQRRRRGGVRPESGRTT